MSSTAIVFKAFNDMNLLQQKFTGIVLGILVVEDLVAVVMLVILSTLAVSQHFEGGALAGSILKLGAFLIFWSVLGIYLLPTLLNKIRRFVTNEILLIASLGLCLLMVMIAVRAGFSSALGAFVMGSLLAETVEGEKISQVVQPVKEALGKKLVISVAAGYPFDRLEQDLAPGTHHLSTVPNTPVSVGEGVIICEEKHSLTAEEYRLVQALFAPLGLMQPVETHLMGIAGTVSGCGPAFVSMFIEALGDAGVMHGLPRATAYRLAGQMVAGTGKLLVEQGAHPGTMKDAVCSPAGTTIVGVAALERKGLRSAVIDAVDAIQQKK